MSRIELICVRHGRTAWNAQGRFQGRTDVALDAEGRRQAAALGAYLSSEIYTLVIASDLDRAMSTARAIMTDQHTPIEPDPRLREMAFGAWEGLTWAQIVEQHPHLEVAAGRFPRSDTPVGGETFDDVCNRVDPVIANITARLQHGGRALLVSHAGIMHAILRITLQASCADALDVRLLPASIMRLHRSSTSKPWELDSINEVVPPIAESAFVTP